MTSDLGQPFEMRQERDGDGAMKLRLYGEFDLAGCEPFRSVFETLSRNGLRELQIDMTELSFIDSSAIRALVDAKRVTEQDGVELVVTLPDDGHVRMVLEITGVDQMLAGR
jgi:anti-sigma B factor antagonist